MEISKQEVSLVQQAAHESDAQAILTLTEFELAVVGGGTGDVIIG